LTISNLHHTHNSDICPHNISISTATKRQTMTCTSPTASSAHGRFSKKRVHFSTTPKQVYDAPQLDEDFYTDYWWQTEDIRNFQVKTKRFIDSASGQSEIMACLQHTYKLASRVACKVNDNKLSKVLKHVPVDANLMLWCCGYPVRGLENYLRDHKFNSHIEYQSAIITWQTTVSNEEELRMVSQYMTRESRIFARMLGQGDSLFLEMPDQTSLTTLCFQEKTATTSLPRKRSAASTKRQVVSNVA
jgi:hypothetical protein